MLTRLKLDKNQKILNRFFSTLGKIQKKKKHDQSLHSKL